MSTVGETGAQIASLGLKYSPVKKRAVAVMVEIKDLKALELSILVEEVTDSSRGMHTTEPCGLTLSRTRTLHIAKALVHRVIVFLLEEESLKDDGNGVLKEKELRGC